MTAPTVSQVPAVAPKQKVTLAEVQVDAYLTNDHGTQLWRVARLKHASSNAGVGALTDVVLEHAATLSKTTHPLADVLEMTLAAAAAKTIEDIRLSKEADAAWARYASTVCMGGTNDQRRWSFDTALKAHHRVERLTRRP